MAQVPEAPQTAALAASPQPAKSPQENEDALVKLYKQLEPISRGLAAQARENPRVFMTNLPRMISGTIVTGLLALIREVGARDEDHEQRLRSLERHPLLSFGEDYDDDLPDPNDPAVLNALLGDVLEYMNVLAGLAEKLPEQFANNAAVQRIPTNLKMVEGMRAGIAYVLEQMDGDGEDDDEGDDSEGDTAPPEIATPPEAASEDEGQARPEAEPEAAPQESTETEETADGQADEGPQAK